MIHAPKNTQPIKHLYAFVSIDKDGNEGILATMTGPLVMGYEDVANKAAKLVRKTQKAGQFPPGTVVRMIKFSNPEVLEVFGGDNGDGTPPQAA